MVMVVMVVIMSIPITRENAGMHIPWEAMARAAKGVDVYGMERAVYPRPLGHGQTVRSLSALAAHAC